MTLWALLLLLLAAGPAPGLIPITAPELHPDNTLYPDDTLYPT